MLFMVIEKFKDGNPWAVGERFRQVGRLMPPGVEYVTSWMTPEGDKCFQINRAPDRASLDAWIAVWDDLVDFEVTPVVNSEEFWARSE